MPGEFCAYIGWGGQYGRSNYVFKTGAFTPVCSAAHVPGYIENLPALRAKGVDVVAVLAYNDAYVMSAWGKANNVKGDDIVSMKLVRDTIE